MKRCVVVLAALLSVLAAIRSAEARGPYGSINVGNWKGGAFTNDQTGESIAAPPKPAARVAAAGPDAAGAPEAKGGKVISARQ